METQGLRGKRISPPRVRRGARDPRPNSSRRDGAGGGLGDGDGAGGGGAHRADDDGARADRGGVHGDRALEGLRDDADHDLRRGTTLGM